MGKRNTEVGCNPFGCAGIIIGIAAVWALVFGVTYDGKHHDVSCSCTRGLDVTTKDAGR